MTAFFDQWLDGVEEGWGIPFLLAVFVVLWTAFLIIAYCNADLHPDVIEAWTLGQTLEWGGTKHPPLMAWVARAWTSVFPVKDWSLQLLAMANSALALWIIDVTARRFTNSDKRVLILLLLMLTPIYQFQAQRFNANSVLFAAWPLAIFCFLRSFESRGSGWAFAAGFAGALALLGKYYSVFLIAGFLFAALLHPDRYRYFSSKAPWISLLAGCLILSPHLHWLVTSGFSPFRYAMAVHGGFTAGQSFLSGLSFLLGLAATLALPLLIWGVIVRSHAGRYLENLRSLDSGLLLLLLIGAGAIISPPVLSLFLKSSLSPVWASPGLFVFVLVAVCAAKFPIDRIETRRLTGAVLGFTVLALLMAPIHAFYRNGHPFSEGRNYYSLATRDLMQRWQTVTTQPLRTVSGDRLAAAVSFYSADRPTYVIPSNQSGEWLMPSKATLAGGWATMCFEGELTCLNWSKQVSSIAPTSIAFDFVAQPRFLGEPGVPMRIYAVMVPPHH